MGSLGQVPGVRTGVFEFLRDLNRAPGAYFQIIQTAAPETAGSAH